ncbi:MAG: DHA2 family efflux MFS transporter permease subunit [Rhizobiales bacterium]|nr:DHA2 family efflux MFS transporter permease subunit [Hyphomicrobiales bacterium]
MATNSSDQGPTTLCRVVVTVCAMLATIMQTLDTTIANVALPYIQGGLSTSPDQITWVLTSYIVAAAIMTAPVGWLAGRFGQRNFFVISLLGFTAASMLCGVAESLPQMVIFRLLQGVFGAALVPLSQATMLDLYPPEQRGWAMAIWGMGIMVGPILGPTLGGYLTDAYNWRWVFYINVPFGILAAIGLALFLTESRPRARSRFDWTGFAYLSLGLASLQLVLDRGELKDWFGSTEIVTELVLACLGFYLFLVHMLLAPGSFIKPRMFHDRNFAAGVVLMFLIGAVLLASMALLPPYLQNLANYPVSTAGLIMAPRGVGTMAAMMLAGRLINRVGARLLMLAGVVVLADSMLRMAYWTPDVSTSTIVTTSLIQGFGFGLMFTPLSIIAFATLPIEFRVDGTAFFSLVRNVGSAIGISVSSVLLTQNTQIMHSRIADSVTPFNRMLQTDAAYLLWNVTTPAGLAALNAEVTRQASIVAYSNDFLFLFFLTLPTAILVLFMRPSAPNGGGQAVPAH